MGIGTFATIATATTAGLGSRFHHFVPWARGSGEDVKRTFAQLLKSSSKRHFIAY